MPRQDAEYHRAYRERKKAEREAQQTTQTAEPPDELVVEATPPRAREAACPVCGRPCLHCAQVQAPGGVRNGSSLGLAVQPAGGWRTARAAMDRCSSCMQLRSGGRCVTKWCGSKGKAG